MINIFENCISLTDVCCYAENVPNTNHNAFANSNIDHAVLRVPYSAVNAYRIIAPWSGFKEVVPIGDVEQNVYNLTYMVDGEIYRIYEVEEGMAITPEPEPTKEGYIFSGWSEIPETMPAYDVMVTGFFERSFNVGDVVNVVNYIMYDNADTDAFALYDMNHDGELNIGDIILLVKYILNHPVYGMNPADRTDEGMADLAQCTAIQFEISVPEGVTIMDINLVEDMKPTHQVIYRQTGANTFAVVVYSLSNQLLQPINGSIVEVVTDGEYLTNFKVSDVTAAKPSGETASYANLPVTTNIRQTGSRSRKAIIYDMRGNRVDDTRGMKQGLYIIDGKKTIVR